MMTTGMTGIVAGQSNKRKDTFANTKQLAEQEHKQHFNMCGYSAPKLDTVRIGFIGLGNRGPVNVDAMAYVEGVEIKALCDKRMVRVENSQKILAKHGLPLKEAWPHSKNSVPKDSYIRELIIFKNEIQTKTKFHKVPFDFDSYSQFRTASFSGIKLSNYSTNKG